MHRYEYYRLEYYRDHRYPKPRSEGLHQKRSERVLLSDALKRPQYGKHYQATDGELHLKVVEAVLDEQIVYKYRGGDAQESYREYSPEHLAAPAAS